jgi:protein-tyrosine phosphatase
MALRRQVLFVCTGNVFRSLTAEYALRAALNGRADIAVASAGTEDRAQLIPPEISGYLLGKGLDVGLHRRRTLTGEIVEATHLVIAMSFDHREFILQRFGRRAPLFLECCGEAAAPMLDIHEAVPDFLSNKVAAVAYLRSTMDRIVELAPRLAGRIDLLLREEAGHGEAKSGSTARTRTVG